MLRVGVVGSLGEHVQAFAAASLRTDVDWSLLSSRSADVPPLDLVLYLKGDAQADSEIGTLERKNSGLGLWQLAASWDDIPPVAALDTALQYSLLQVYGFVIGYSPAMHEACRWIRAVAHQASAALDLRTLIIGETGTGKELVAKTIHKMRSENQPFVAVNCGAFSSDLADSELFGHVRGAFTSAVADRSGALRTAGAGVLFLDEIGDLPLGLQAKFLRAIEERSFSAVGSDRTHPFRAQVISATNRRLDDLVKEGRFRPDLYFRIAQVTILLPPLRERTEDIMLLVDYFLHLHNVPVATLDNSLLESFPRYSWPGNIRELRSIIDRTVLLQRTGERVSSLDKLISPALLASAAVNRGTLADLRNDFDRRVLEEVLARCGGDTGCAAEQLGITRRSVYNLAHRHGIVLETMRKN